MFNLLYKYAVLLVIKVKLWLMSQDMSSKINKYNAHVLRALYILEFLSFLLYYNNIKKKDLYISNSLYASVLSLFE